MASIPAGNRVGIVVAGAPPTMKKDAARRREVLIVSANPETLDGLQAYLDGAGLTARGTRELAACAKVAAPLAVVLFPDDFRWEKVAVALADLAERRPSVLVVVVSSHPQKFDALAEPGELLVVPKPVWGWAILDAIRAQVERADTIKKR